MLVGVKSEQRLFTTMSARRAVAQVRTHCVAKARAQNRADLHSHAQQLHPAHSIARIWFDVRDTNSRQRTNIDTSKFVPNPFHVLHRHANRQQSRGRRADSHNNHAIILEITENYVEKHGILLQCSRSQLYAGLLKKQRQRLQLQLRATLLQCKHESLQRNMSRAA